MQFIFYLKHILSSIKFIKNMAPDHIALFKFQCYSKNILYKYNRYIYQYLHNVYMYYIKLNTSKILILVGTLHIFIKKICPRNVYIICILGWQRSIFTNLIVGKKLEVNRMPRKIIIIKIQEFNIFGWKFGCRFVMRRQSK